MITAVFVAPADFAGNTVSVGTVTFRMICKSLPGTVNVLSCWEGFGTPGTFPCQTGSTCRVVSGAAGTGGCCAYATLAASNTKTDKLFANHSFLNSFMYFPPLTRPLRTLMQAAWVGNSVFWTGGFGGTESSSALARLAKQLTAW